MTSVAATDEGIAIKVSARVDYALRALCALARRGDGGPVAAREIAAAESIPSSFLDAILFDLRRAGLIASKRGPVGGHRLLRAAQDITVADVIRAVEGCAAEPRRRDAADDGPMAALWAAAEAGLAGVLETATVGRLAREEAGALQD